MPSERKEKVLFTIDSAILSSHEIEGRHGLVNHELLYDVSSLCREGYSGQFIFQ